MNPAIVKFWHNVSAYYQKKLTDEVIKMYAYDCKDFSVPEIQKAFEVYREGPQAQFMPLPVTLKNILRPPVDEVVEANLVPNAIFKAISKHGYGSSQSARDDMGELAWKVVEGFGGWYNLCTNPKLGNESTLRAQMRDMAKSQLKRIQSGRAGLKPGQGISALIPDAKQEEPKLLDDNIRSIVPKPKSL